MEPTISREEKEKLLNQRMENIRRKNEELRKRHQEIEADKKNADKFSSTVTMDEVKPYVMKVPRPRPEKSERSREMSDCPPPPRPADIMPSRQRLAENDGPPPDPSYRFLSDPERDGTGDRREQGGRTRGKRAKGGSGDGEEGAWDGRGSSGRRSTRGNKGGFDSGNKREEEGWTDNNSVEMESSDGRFRGQGDGFRYGRGKGRERDNEPNNFDGESWFGRGGRGRGRGYDRFKQDGEHAYMENGSDNGPPRSREGRGKSGFKSRDIRYYPDDGDSGGGRRQSSGRGRASRNSFDDNDQGFDRGRGRGRTPYSLRGRGRGRGHQREYERWKAEREAIDEARVNRGRTQEGAWRREWDNDKLDQGEADDQPVYDARHPKSKSEGIRLRDFMVPPNGEDGGVATSPTSPRDNQQHTSRNNRNTRGNLRAMRHEEEMSDRKAEGRGDSFTICPPNTAPGTAGEDDSQVIGKFVRVGSGRMARQNRHAQNDGENSETDRQSHRGRGRAGHRGQHSRGKGQKQNRSANKGDSPNMMTKTEEEPEYSLGNEIVTPVTPSPPNLQPQQNASSPVQDDILHEQPVSNDVILPDQKVSEDIMVANQQRNEGVILPDQQINENDILSDRQVNEDILQNQHLDEVILSNEEVNKVHIHPSNDVDNSAGDEEDVFEDVHDDFYETFEEKEENKEMDTDFHPRDECNSPLTDKSKANVECSNEVQAEDASLNGVEEEYDKDTESMILKGSNIDVLPISSASPEESKEGKIQVDVDIKQVTDDSTVMSLDSVDQPIGNDGRNIDNKIGSETDIDAKQKELKEDTLQEAVADHEKECLNKQGERCVEDQNTTTDIAAPTSPTPS